MLLYAAYYFRFKAHMTGFMQVRRGLHGGGVWDGEGEGGMDAECVRGDRGGVLRGVAPHADATLSPRTCHARLPYVRRVYWGRRAAGRRTPQDGWMQER